MAGRRDELRVAKGVELGQRALQACRECAGTDDGRRGVDGEPQQLKQFAIPVAGLQIDQAGVSGVGVLGDAASAEPMEDILRHA